MTQTTSAATGAGEIELFGEQEEHEITRATYGARIAVLEAALAASRQREEELRKALTKLLDAQLVGPPYRGWSITELNRAAGPAREMLGLPSVRELNPDIARMQDHAAALSEKPAAEKEVG